MTRRIKRNPNFEISLTIRNDDFIRPPTDGQRNSLLNRTIKEFADDVVELDRHAANFVAGALDTGLSADRTQQELSDNEIMEDWQLPILQAMADSVCRSGGDILEVGFGRGISAAMIQEHTVRSHTIIECNDSVIDRFGVWQQNFADRRIDLVRGLWQDVIDSLGLFDGIFFHTYPLTEEEYMQYVHNSVTFAEHFFEPAAAHLRTGGAFCYFSNEIDSLSRAHQRALLKHFSSFSVRVVDLEMPSDVKDTWWADSMAIVTARR